MEMELMSVRRCPKRLKNRNICQTYDFKRLLSLYHDHFLFPLCIK